MKKTVMSLLTVLSMAFVLSACDPTRFFEGVQNAESSLVESSFEQNSTSQSENDWMEDSFLETSSKAESDEQIENESQESVSSSSIKEEEPEESKYTYTDFTASEKAMFTQMLGEVIPFLPNNEYEVEEYTYEEGDYVEEGLNFYTYGNTQAEFDAYRAKFGAFTLVDTYEDEDGDTWYCYDKGELCVDMAYYETEDGYCADVYAFFWTEDGGGNTGSGEETSYTYTDFTASEKAMFTQMLGEVIPFLPNNEYEVEEYTYEDGDYVEEGLNFYTYGNTQTEFDAYRAKFGAFTLVDTYEDEYGDTWYCYDKGELCVDMAYYETEDGYCADVYAFFWTEDGGGNTGSGDVGGDDSGDVGGDTDVEIMTNAGKGLPTGVNGVYNVDFTKATHVKNVTDQGYYLDGCPTVSGNADPAVLVIPVEFSDVTAASKGYTVATIKKAFNGGAGETDYYSVHEYYLQSSYGKLDLDITVLDSWFKPQYASSYYANATMDCEGYETACGDQLIIDEALAYLSKSMDLSKFDSDSNGVIDAIVLINTLDINDEVDFQWAYRYWNMYTDDEGYYYEYDGVSANDYLWASYQFLHESESGWDDTTGINTYTYIHEFGHVLGADDYYDTAYVGSPMGDFDMMDGMAGDHNAYSKFNYGWLTTSRLVVADESVTLTIEDFSKNGDTVLIANNWDETLGAYQEYYIVVYYTNNGVNVGGGYFDDEGIIVYHVNASLYKEIYEGKTYYDVYNNNTDASDEYGTEDNLIEYVTTKTGEYVYGVGDSLSASTTDDQGNKIAYTFMVDALTDTTATLTFTKNK